MAASGRPGWAGPAATSCSSPTRPRAGRSRRTDDLGFGDTPTIDLDAVCFGFDNCAYLQGGPGTTSGTFHPTPPTRILDTRFGVGITNGAIRSGGGRINTPDPNTRRDETANHELKVTGVGGVPEAGVSAVLLNVTAVVPPGPGYVAVTPKAAACCGGLAIFDDQASVPVGEPATSNLNVAGGDIVPNLVLARVGAGGKIRIYNWLGPTHMVADVAGWFDTGGSTPMARDSLASPPPASSTAATTSAPPGAYSRRMRRDRSGSRAWPAFRRTRRQSS